MSLTPQELSRHLPPGWRTWDPWSKRRLLWRLSTDLNPDPTLRRPEQLTPEGDWTIWLVMAGRGFGKTRTGAEDFSDFLRRHAGEGMRLGCIAPTQSDVRDTMIEGESGLLSVLPPSAFKKGSVEVSWNRSLLELTLADGNRVKGFSSERPGKLRGPQHHRLWFDEPAEFNDADLGDVRDTTWNNAMLGMRLGQHPQAIVTGTPKRVLLMRQLLKRFRDGRGVHLTTGSTYQNLHNLSPTFREEVLASYEGTRLAKQELQGRLLEEVTGALWAADDLDKHRCPSKTFDRDWLARAGVAVDPAVRVRDMDAPAEMPGAMTGIIAGGVSAARAECPYCGGEGPHLFITEDETCDLGPAGWAHRVHKTVELTDADLIVAEANQGGELVRHTLQSESNRVPIRMVHASRGKRVRAEPVAALFEQGKAHLVGEFTDLEDQLLTWTPDDKESPDRMDAMVWLATHFMLAGNRVSARRTRDRRHTGRR